jgi:endo-1,3(4)-beta-glucanase
MAIMARFLLAFAHFSAVYGLPAGEALQKNADLDERQVSLPLAQEVTTSYSRAITSLQSATISVLPSITGVRI